VTHLALVHRGTQVGQLEVVARAGERLSAPDLRRLEQLQPFLAATADAMRVNDELRRTHEALLDAHVVERRRVRRDLHDGLGPTLASVRLKLTALRRQLPAHLSLDATIEQTTDAIRELRRIADGLQPSLLEDLGLVAALQILIADTSATTGITVSLHTADNFADLAPHLATTAYRVVAEGLANTARHSHATRCAVELAHTDDGLSIAITDNGHGFDTTTNPGAGLRSIAERAHRAAGSAHIHSDRHTGTTIRVILPT
jgi:signal transduction histidine kinase